MDLSELKETLAILTQKYDSEVKKLITQYRETNLLINVSDVITVDTEFLKKFFRNDIFKSNSSRTILRCIEIKPSRSYKINIADNLAESMYVMEELTLKGTKKKYKPLNEIRCLYP